MPDEPKRIGGLADEPTPGELMARRRFAGYLGIALLVFSMFIVLAGHDLRGGVVAFIGLCWLIASRLW